ncbi:MAG: hypothetical protein ACR2GZ_11520 [Solirubrobacteraceae bacterium]
MSSRADARLVPLAIDRYQRRIVGSMRAHQRDSRRLAKAMFVEGGLSNWARDRLLRHVPASAMIRSILNAMRQTA